MIECYFRAVNHQRKNTLYDKFKKDSNQPVKIIKDNNAKFDIALNTTDNRLLHTSDLFFEPKVSKEGENQVLSMKLKVSDSEYLEYRYTLTPDDYMMGFGIKTVGLQNVVNTSQPINLDWQLKGYRHAKSITYENRYTRLTYEYEEGDHDKLSQTGDDDAIEGRLIWQAPRSVADLRGDVEQIQFPEDRLRLLHQTAVIDQPVTQRNNLPHIER